MAGKGSQREVNPASRRRLKGTPRLSASYVWRLQVTKRRYRIYGKEGSGQSSPGTCGPASGFLPRIKFLGRRNDAAHPGLLWWSDICSTLFQDVAWPRRTGGLDLQPPERAVASSPCPVPRHSGLRTHGARRPWVLVMAYELLLAVIGK